MSIKQAGSFSVKKGKIFTKDHFLKMPPLIQGVIHTYFGTFRCVQQYFYFYKHSVCSNIHPGRCELNQKVNSLQKGRKKIPSTGKKLVEWYSTSRDLFILEPIHSCFWAKGVCCNESKLVTLYIFSLFVWHLFSRRFSFRLQSAAAAWL